MRQATLHVIWAQSDDMQGSVGPHSEDELSHAAQGTQGGMGNLFSSHLAGDAGAPEPNVSGGLPLSEADGMPSLSGISPSDAAAFLQSNKKACPVLAGPSCGQSVLH